MNDRTAGITRGIIALITIVNMALMAFDINPINIDEGLIAEAVSAVALVVVGVWTWWKNSNITPEAEEAQKELDRKKKLTKAQK